MDVSNLSASNIFAGFAFGVFGWYIFQLGRKQGNVWHVIIGLLLMIYPYFVSGSFLMWAIGIGLMIVAYAKR